MKNVETRKDAKPNIFKKCCNWLIKPKSCNVTVCWIFTLAAILPIACWLIFGESGLLAGVVLGVAFAFFGFIIALWAMD